MCLRRTLRGFKFVEDLKEKLEDEGIKVNLYHDIQGEINGMILMLKGQSFKLENLKPHLKTLNRLLMTISSRKKEKGTDYSKLPLLLHN
jgi:hypothetical protein